MSLENEYLSELDFLKSEQKKLQQFNELNTKNMTSTQLKAYERGIKRVKESIKESETIIKEIEGELRDYIKNGGKISQKVLNTLNNNTSSKKTDKLIKVGVKYTDKYFDNLKKIYLHGFNNNPSMEAFLDETKDYSISNPLEGQYIEDMTKIINNSINDIRFSRPAQKRLMNEVITNTTGELIRNVGEDVKNTVKDIVRRGYNDSKSNHVKYAKEISSRLDGINSKRARCIARTEIKRAYTTSDYLINKERGANVYDYDCGANPCDLCKKDCGKTFPITDLEHLPPRHPNCNCDVIFYFDPDYPVPR